MTLMAVTMMAMSANAQVYMGGSVGIGSVKDVGGDYETTYKLLPEIGYSFNKDWAVGVMLGVSKGTCDFSSGNFSQNTKTEIVTINPYARYTFLRNQFLNLFIDGGLGYTSYDDIGDEFNFGLRPGVAVNLTSKLSFVAHYGFFGYRTFNPDADGVKSANMFGLDLDGNQLTFGLYYNF